ncbi:Transposase, IS4 family [hydrothermal vent metagenome]|uniref:Transposase, IS4 family n=1 Tax=hydrothermal vent metagenome TaxID=652676 RepID=A0A3B0ZK59_9ZZZZ
MKIPFKTDKIEAHQHLLFPSNLFDRLPEAHDCFLYASLFDQLDTSEVEALYSHKGQHGYSPRKLIGILIYGYSHGVFSSRQLEQRCKEDLGFMYTAGLNCPNFRVLSDFRKNHGAFFKSCFKQTVQLALELKLASLGHVSLDGSHFKANSSKHKSMSYKRLKAQEKTLMKEVEQLIGKASRCDAEEDAAYKEKTGYELPEDLKFKQQRLEKIKAAKAALEAREAKLNPDQPIADKKQISFADTDARIMGKGKDFDYSYNPQVSVDGDNQIIVGQHMSQQANDMQEVKPALDELKESAGQLPEKLSMDNGYFSGNNLIELEEAMIDAYVAPGRGEVDGECTALADSQRKLVKSDFEYDEKTDCFRCPQGQMLPLIKQDKAGRRFYQGESSTCTSCPYKSRCCQSKQGQARTISADDKEPQRQAMREKMNTSDATEIYKKRKHIVEPVFGQIKNGGFRKFSLRGIEKVKGEFSLVCTAHNIKKIVTAAFKGLVCPKSNKWTAITG